MPWINNKVVQQFHRYHYSHFIGRQSKAWILTFLVLYFVASLNYNRSFLHSKTEVVCPAQWYVDLNTRTLLKRNFVIIIQLFPSYILFCAALTWGAEERGPPGPPRNSPVPEDTSFIWIHMPELFYTIPQRIWDSLPSAVLITCLINTSVIHWQQLCHINRIKVCCTITIYI